jgi:hypothetical protein
MGTGVGPFADFGLSNADNGVFAADVAHENLRADWSDGVLE